MRTLASLLLNPIIWLIVGFFILWCFRKKWKTRTLRFGYSFLGLMFYFFLTPVLPFFLISRLEFAYPPLRVETLDTAKSYHIVVLGGGMGYDDRLPATSLLETVMLGRLVEGIRVHNKLPTSIIITSGYSSIGRKPQAEVAREAAIILGVNPGRVFAQGEPANTWQEAQQYVKDWGTRNPVIIASSAIHQKRAIYLFKKAGVQTVLAAPTNYRFKKDNPRPSTWFLKPRFSNLSDIGTALHEIVGYYHASVFI